MTIVVHLSWSVIGKSESIEESRMPRSWTIFFIVFALHTHFRVLRYLIGNIRFKIEEKFYILENKLHSIASVAYLLYVYFANVAY